MLHSILRYSLPVHSHCCYHGTTFLIDDDIHWLMPTFPDDTILLLMMHYSYHSTFVLHSLFTVLPFPGISFCCSILFILYGVVYICWCSFWWYIHLLHFHFYHCSHSFHSTWKWCSFHSRYFCSFWFSHSTFVRYYLLRDTFTYLWYILWLRSTVLMFISNFILFYYRWWCSFHFPYHRYSRVLILPLHHVVHSLFSFCLFCSYRWVISCWWCRYWYRRYLNVFLLHSTFIRPTDDGDLRYILMRWHSGHSFIPTCSYHFSVLPLPTFLPFCLRYSTTTSFPTTDSCYHCSIHTRCIPITTTTAVTFCSDTLFRYAFWSPPPFDTVVFISLPFPLRCSTLFDALFVAILFYDLPLRSWPPIVDTMILIIFTILFPDTCCSILFIRSCSMNFSFITIETLRRDDYDTCSTFVVTLHSTDTIRLFDDTTTISLFILFYSTFGVHSPLIPTSILHWPFYHCPVFSFDTDTDFMIRYHDAYSIRYFDIHSDFGHLFWHSTCIYDTYSCCSVVPTIHYCSMMFCYDTSTFIRWWYVNWWCIHSSWPVHLRYSVHSDDTTFDRWWLPMTDSAVLPPFGTVIRSFVDVVDDLPVLPDEPFTFDWPDVDSTVVHSLIPTFLPFLHSLRYHFTMHSLRSLLPLFYILPLPATGVLRFLHTIRYTFWALFVTIPTFVLDTTTYH